MILFIIFTVLFIVYIICSRNKRMEKLIKQFPGPPAYPVIGNIFNYFTTDLQVMKNREIAAFLKYGETFRAKVPRSYIVSTINARLFEKVLGNSTYYMEKADDYNIMKPIIGNGLVLSRGYQWHSQRKIIQPAFSVGVLKQFLGIFDQKAKILVDLLKTQCNGMNINVDKFVAPLACDILMETSMGLRIDTQSNKDLNEYVQAIGVLKYLCCKKITSYWKRYDILYSTFGFFEKRLFAQNIAIARNYSIEVIEKRREVLLQQNQINQINDENNKGMCFVDSLLRSTIDGETLSNEQILNEAQTFMIAGQDTTSYTISATLYLLSRHKTIQDKVFAEIDEVIGRSRDIPITYQQFLDLKYMEMVVKESMRLYPAVEMIGREINHDLKLDDGRIIPAGVDMRLYLGLMMKNEKYFKNPLHFDPERFASQEINQYVYVPFSAGKRDCIGKKFASFSTKTVLCRIIQSYELIEMGDEPIIQSELLARSLNGFQMALKLRENV